MAMTGVGVIGCGHWGPNHLRNFSASGRSHLAALAEKDPARRERTAAAFPGVRAVATAEELLALPEVEAVVVATPTSTHHALVKAALAAGKHVLCEKPLTLRAGESAELAALAGKAGRVLMVGHTFLYNDGIAALKGLIDSGETGAPLYTYLRRTNLGPIRRDVNVVYDLASHDIYIANHLLGKRPLSVSAQGATYLQPGLEDVAFITLHYPDNQLANIHVSWLDPRKVRQITLVGERKMALWDDISPEALRVYDKRVQVGEADYQNFGQYQLILKEGDVVIPKLTLREPLMNMTRHFLDCVEGKAVPLSGGEEGLEVVRVLEAAQESLACGRTVEVRR